MSIDSNSETVKSKYFANQTDMDESLSDFQEAKKSCTGPKPAQKTTKPKTRKTTKRIKGQKDIRTALKGKKNDLVSYTKDFDTVCKKSGLDVDSEQLQLAIALSKSLQTEPETPETSQVLTSQQRVAKIRKTLQEYGFKVPEAKITTTKKTKKFRKNYKLLTATEEQKKEIITGKYAQILFQNIHVSLDQNSPNNLDSEARVFYIGSSVPYECMKDDEIFYVDSLVERSETNGSLLRDWSEIPGRPVSPLLFDSFKMSFKEIECSQDELDVILSGSIKNVKNIFASKEIEFENHVQKINIDDDKENVDSDNNRSQINNMIKSIDDNDQECEAESKPLSQNLFDFESPVKNDMKSQDRTVIEIKLPDDEVIEITSPVKLTTDPKKIIDIESTNNLTVPQQYRSCSPDIFDDELSSIMETTKPANILSQEHKTKVFSQDNVMDLTECVNIPSQRLEKTLLSQNITKRRSNDFMEITECIVRSSQPIREELKEIDLTQSPEANDAIKERNHSINAENNIDNVSIILCTNSRSNSVSQNVTDEQNVTVLRKCPNTDSTQSQIKEDVDLTQSSNEDDKDMRIVNLSIQKPDKKDVESMDLTQSSNSDDVDGLPLVNIGTQKVDSLDETIIVDKDEYNNIAIGKVKKSIVFEKETLDEVYDLTQAHDDSTEIPVTNENNDSQCYSFYDDYVHDHSENTENSKEVEQNKDKTEDDKTSHNESKESDDVDLTQDSDMSEERHVSQRSLVLDNIPNNSSLGKKDDVSIDYDEIILDENICHQESYKESDNDKSLNLKYESFKSEVGDDIEIVDVNNDIEMNSSQHSEVFEISDRELDYSMHKSRHDFVRDNFDIGGISILDNATKLSSFKKSLSEGCLSVIGPVKDDTLGDSFLPEVFTKKTENTVATTATYIHTPGEISPIKVQDVTRNDNGVIHIKTPKNTEYVIKTDNVTPMADYASMSTPQRNRELDKYGLKPFKRKRAVQILTHLYNQTHPTIQQLADDQPSPSKKQRLNYDTEETSPQKLVTSPAKLNQNSNTQRTPVKSRTLERDKDILSAPSPSKGGISADVCVYEITSETANLKSVDCDPDDWVFQKREKAKVHSCRVPLHIAFHNYVLSRRSLREAILKYEPVNIDIIHKDLVGYGHRYDPKDLLKFLDKKCITVKTTDNNSRNNKR